MNGCTKHSDCINKDVPKDRELCGTYVLLTSLFLIAAMFVAEPLDKVRGIAGRDMMLMCRLATSDEHPPKTVYQWYNEERPNSNNFKYLKGQTSNILRLSSELCKVLRSTETGSLFLM